MQTIPKKKVLVDIGHPAHVHFFSHPIRIWLAKGHEVIITSRKKEIATDLLDELGLSHHVLSAHPGKGTLLNLFAELISRNKALLSVVRKQKPDIMVGIGGVNIAHVRMVTGVPAIAFYDTENATLSNAITYPFASLVAVPECYKAWLPPWHLKYPGYHELSYLHPNRFRPSKSRALEAGLAPDADTFLIRTVSWQASHDVSERGWSEKLLIETVRYLSQRGKVLVSSEGDLPQEIKQHRYTGPVTDIHHVMAFCRLFVGESATMASECAVLGCPAIYAAYTGRGYTDEEESRYNLVKNVRELSWPRLKDAIDFMLSREKGYYMQKRQQLLKEKIDVAAFVAELALSYPKVAACARRFGFSS